MNINYNKSFDNDLQNLSKSFDFSFDVINSQKIQENKTCSTNQTVYSNYFPNQTKKNFRNFSQKKLPLDKSISPSKKFMMNSQSQQQVDEYQCLNKRLLEGFLKLRKQIFQTENQTYQQKDLSNCNAKQSANFEGSNLSTLNSYEPLANIKLKLFKRNLKKNQIQNYQKNINENILSMDQQSKYSLFDNTVSKCSYKAIDLTNQFNLNKNQEDHSKFNNQTKQNSEQKQNKQYLLKTQQNICKKNNFKTQDLKQCQIQNKSKIKNDKSKNENTFYNFQSNDLSTRVSFYNINKSDSKNDRIINSQHNFFYDCNLSLEETQNMNSSRSQSPQSETSLIFNPPKEIHQELSFIKPEVNLNSKFQKIKLNLCRPKSQDSYNKLKPFPSNKNQRKQSQFVQSFQNDQKSINSLIHEIKNSDQIQPSKKSELQNAFSIKIENQIEEISHGYDDKVLNNQDKKIQINCDEQQERNQQLNSKLNREIIGIESKEQINRQESKELIQKQESKEFIQKQESRESIQDFKLFQIEIDQEIEQKQFEVFNQYLSQNTYFMGKKLKNSKMLNSKDSTSKIVCRKSTSFYRLRNQQNQSQNKFFNELMVDQFLHTKKPFEINIQDTCCKQEQKNRGQNKQQQKHFNISQRKYSYDSSQQNKNTRFFEIQMMSYKPIGLQTSNNQIDMQTQNYFNKQLITNSIDKSLKINCEQI
ncbi:hypothetical protein TTHERM_00129370 (macronuclear) [Tetrahymena thermophila SB210]|uniref:Uncharacterized protein n=1 Tax=Tetrahymena thermophila (strain SB210) TaxID=312017 RepID=I7MJB8_TETTS|nr:hypothetical protein TTHERM_00129370 [Tetrahymena thermophila SB210]EAR96161.2 hypothetical protein TTHERM_00129370 [Tetrahymena thermophila SB210]|eukprot:XP_001016406.2 hypothetical protein TTHERM_00129370 [Tetrahymena thermophila SB210]